MASKTWVWVVIAVAVGAGVLIAAAFMGFARVSLTPYVALIELNGVIGYSKSFLTGAAIIPDDVDYLVDTVMNDPMARAVVISISSPGGSAAASEEIYLRIKELSRVKPVVVYCREVMASGGYYISLPARKIVASPHCIVGSVGAIAVVYDVKGLMERLGINVTIIKSGRFKDIGSYFRGLTREEYEMLYRIVNETAGVFRDRVIESRGSVSSEVFKAGIYSAKDAVKLGLIDAVGSIDDAADMARDLAGLPSTAPLIRVEKPKSLIEALLEGLSTPLKPLKATYLEPGVYYLWLPG